MKLMIGGAWQGKREFAKAAFGVAEEEIFTCHGEQIDFSAKCIDKIEEFTFSCAKAGIDPVECFRREKEKWQDSILICQDLFCGVVPVDPVLRQWRQDTGRLCQYLSREAEQVSRIFCGLEQRLK